MNFGILLSRSEALDLLAEAGCAPNVIEHCKAVARLAGEIAKKIKNTGREVDMELVEIGALVHDLGRCRTHGIEHALEGFRLAQKKGIDPRLAEIIKRHIGAGLSREEAINFGLPDDDYFPHTLEEKIVAHADNLLMGTKRISIEERLFLMKERGVGKEAILRTSLLAREIAVAESAETER
ncbi:MAG: TIGR00295 family protein [Methanosarcinaceae archaeon]|nr:TIGR00295 family protein [Methanosarcinaceae archaeon]MDD4331998.1 TIGR00295 family protein [Methanosarcinaceae archaeon]MDD4748444.1 TIGR00295 family protein [Methanosarcinaceae archaeon]